MKKNEIIESFFSDFLLGDLQDCDDIFLGWLSKSENKQGLISALEESRGKLEKLYELSLKMVDNGFDDDVVWCDFGTFTHSLLDEILAALGCPSGPYR